MTIETITVLIHKHMYDRLNNSNNSNDGGEIKHVQERPHKRNRADKSDADRTKKRPEYQKQKARDNRRQQSGGSNWLRQHICPAKMAECRILKLQKRPLRKDVQIEKTSTIRGKYDIVGRRRQMGI